MKTFTVSESEFQELLSALRTAHRHEEDQERKQDSFSFEHGFHAHSIKGLLQALNPKAITQTGDRILRDMGVSPGCDFSFTAQRQERKAA